MDEEAKKITVANIDVGTEDANRSLKEVDDNLSHITKNAYKSGRSIQEAFKKFVSPARDLKSAVTGLDAVFAKFEMAKPFNFSDETARFRDEIAKITKGMSGLDIATKRVTSTFGQGLKGNETKEFKARLREEQSLLKEKAKIDAKIANSVPLGGSYANVGFGPGLSEPFLSSNMKQSEIERYSEIQKRLVELRRENAESIASGEAFNIPSINAVDEKLKSERSTLNDIVKEFGRISSYVEKAQESILLGSDAADKSVMRMDIRTKKSAYNIKELADSLSGMISSDLKETYDKMSSIASSMVPTKDYQTAINLFEHWKGEQEKAQKAVDSFAKTNNASSKQLRDKQVALDEATSNVLRYELEVLKLEQAGNHLMSGRNTDEYKELARRAEALKTIEETYRSMLQTSSVYAQQADARLASSAKSILEKNAQNLMGGVMRDVQKGLKSFSVESQAAMYAAGTSVSSSTLKMSDEQKSLQHEFNKSVGSIDNLREKVEKLMATDTGRLAKGFTSIKYDADKAVASIKDNGEKLSSSMAQTIFNIKQAMFNLSEERLELPDYKAAHETVAQLTKQYDELASTLRGYVDRGLDDTDSRVLKVKRDMETTSVSIEKAMAHMESLRASGQAFVYGKDTTSYSNLATQLEQAESLVYESQRRVEESSKQMGETMQNAMAAAAQASAEDMANKSGKAAQAFAGKITNWIVRALKRATSDVKKFGRHAKSSFNGAGRGANNFTKWLTGARKGASSADTVVKKLSRTMHSFFRQLRWRVLRAAVADVFKDIQNNMGQVATISDRFNTAISYMIDSTKQLGAQLIASLEPIISIVGPIIASLVDKITSAADAMSQFIARVTGNQMYLRATKGQSNYAASLDKTTSSTKKANKAAKDYQNTVLGFDQLNKLNGVDDNAIGIDDADIDKAWTNANALNELADAIYDAFRRHDYAGAGKLFGEGITMGFSWLSDVIGWDKNSKKLKGILKNVIDFVNGFWTGIDTKTVGTSIGDIANTFIESLKVLTDPEEGLDLELAGETIGETLLYAIKKIEWKDLGTAVVNTIQKGLDYVRGLLTAEIEDEETGEMLTIGKSLGRAFSRLFTGAIDAIRPEDWGKTIASLINSFTGFMSEAFSKPEDAAKLGTDIGKTINEAISGIDADSMAGAITNIARSFNTFIASVFEEVDWKGALNKLSEILKSENFSLGEIMKSIGILSLPSLIKSAVVGGGSLIISGMKLLIKHKLKGVIAGWLGGTSGDIVAGFSGMSGTLTTGLAGVFKGVFTAAFSIAIPAAIGIAAVKFADWLPEFGVEKASGSFKEGKRWAEFSDFLSFGQTNNAAEFDKLEQTYREHFSGLFSSIDDFYRAVVDNGNGLIDTFTSLDGTIRVVNGNIMSEQEYIQSQWVSSADQIVEGARYTKDEAGHLVEYTDDMATKMVNGVDVATNNVIYTSEQAMDMLSAKTEDFSDTMSGTLAEIKYTTNQFTGLGMQIRNLYDNLTGRLIGSSHSMGGGRGSIGHYASGGIVGDGQLFVANEGGRAELIGDDGRGNTAVVNNNQIIDAVVTGVRQAFNESLADMADVMASRGGGDRGPIQLVLKDNRILAEEVDNGRRRLDKQYNQVSFA